MMKRRRRLKPTLPAEACATRAEAIAEKATRGEDVSRHFTNKFRVVKPRALGDEGSRK
jgi:hypothetical protein